MRYCVGVDIGGTTVKIGLFTVEGILEEKWEIPTYTENQGKRILPDTAKSIRDKLDERGIPATDVNGIGIGVPAPVKKDGIVQNTANLGWGYKEVKKEMEELSGLRTEVGNDANVAALGEMWLGAAKGRDNIIMITLGTGVGGGIIVDGKPLVGAHGAGGEIGHICMDYEDTDKCGCGNTGCLEVYASATGIVRLANRRLAKDETPSLLRKGEVSAKAVFDAYKAGDVVAEDIAEAFASYLGHGIANLAAVTDPAAVVIGGGVSKAGAVLIPLIKKYFDEKAFFADRDLEFLMASLGNDAGICGAAKLIMD